MWRFFVELASYLSFIVALSLVTFLYHSQEKFLQARHLRRLFLNPNNATHDLSQVSAANVR